MYNVVIPDRASKDLEKIDKKTQKIILLKIKEYSSNPFRYSIRLTDTRIGDYRFRIGKYRIIFDIDGENLVVLRIGHRKNIYKNI